MRKNILALFGIVAITGCTNLKSFVKADAALGRVIIYRNGIAYYERNATVSDQKLTLHVPADKVNDFLKSLTVVDVKTGQALPVDFPQPGHSDANGNVEMTVRLPEAGSHQLRLSYVSEAPAWKPSYRLMVDEKGKVALQGWAIVDNTSGEDWQSVKVGVGSSSALSFRYDLQSIRTIDREMLRPEELFAQAPPTGASTYKQSETVVLAELEPMPEDAPPPPEAAMPMTTSRSPGKRALNKSGALDSLGGIGGGPGGDGKFDQLAGVLRGRKDMVTIEDYATSDEEKTNSKARASRLRDELIRRGVPAAQIQVVSKGVVPGHRGVRVVQGATVSAPAPAKEVAITQMEPVGESHFESPVPMTVKRGSSAMVSIVNSATAGEVVYLYDSESARGNDRFAFKAVRFLNPSSSTLEAGPMTVYGKERFIGEGMSDSIPGNATAVIPFALDRQVIIEHGDSNQDRIVSLQKAVRGVFTAEIQHRRKLDFKITNRLPQATTVYVRHVLPAGYQLITPAKSPANSIERSGDAHLFRVELAAGQTKQLTLEEETPVERSLDLRSGDAMGLLRVYLQAPNTDPALAQALQKLLKLDTVVAQHDEKIQSLRERSTELRVRMDELHAQIVDLQALRTGGELLGNLKAKLREISDQVQQNTLKIVDEQEKMMVAKVQLADGLSDLTLDHKSVASR